MIAPRATQPVFRGLLGTGGMTRQPRPRWADDIDDNDRAAPTDAAAGGGEKLATIANFHRYESRRRSRNCEQIAISHQRGHRLYQPNRCPPRAQAGRWKVEQRPPRSQVRVVVVCGRGDHGQRRPRRDVADPQVLTRGCLGGNRSLAR